MTPPNKQTDISDLYDAILDLTRVTLAVSGKFASQSEAIRKLAELSIPASRISALLALPLNTVTSALSKARKMRNVAEDPSADTPGE